MRAEPVDGAANEALVRLLASALDVPRSTIRIVVGSTGRRKVIDVQGIDADVLRSRWPGLDV